MSAEDQIIDLFRPGEVTQAPREALLLDQLIGAAPTSPNVLETALDGAVGASEVAKSDPPSSARATAGNDLSEMRSAIPRELAGAGENVGTGLESLLAANPEQLPSVLQAVLGLYTDGDAVKTALFGGGLPSQASYLRQIANRPDIAFEGGHPSGVSTGTLPVGAPLVDSSFEPRRGRGGKAMQAVMNGILELIEIHSNSQSRSALANGYLPTR